MQNSDWVEQEVWLTAHLCDPKPGACDNSSGVALGVEIMRTVATLIRSGRLPRPRRTLRLLLLPEMSGAQAYMDRHQERMDKVGAVAASMQPALAANMLALVQSEGLHALTILAEDLDPAGATFLADQVNPCKSDRLWAMVERENGALQSVVNAFPPIEQSALAAVLAQHQIALTNWAASNLTSPALTEAADAARLPTRIEKWPLNWGKIERSIVDGPPRLQALKSAVNDFEDKAIAALNYVDGSRSLAQIARLVNGEIGNFPLEQAIGYFDLLAEAGVVAF